MKQLISLSLISILLLLFSCDKEGNQGEVLDITSYSTHEFLLAEEIFADLTLFYSQVMLNDREYLKTQFELLASESDSEQSIDVESFYKETLGVNSALVDKIVSYPEEKIAIIEYELANPASNGVVYKYWLNKVDAEELYFPIVQSESPIVQSDSDITFRRDPCAPDCCGGWRPLLLVLSSASCLAGSVYACIGAVVSWDEFIQDGCIS